MSTFGILMHLYGKKMCYKELSNKGNSWHNIYRIIYCFS